MLTTVLRLYHEDLQTVIEQGRTVTMVGTDEEGTRIRWGGQAMAMHSLIEIMNRTPDIVIDIEIDDDMIIEVETYVDEAIEAFIESIHKQAEGEEDV